MSPEDKLVMWAVLLYAGFSGICGWLMIRPMVVNWYHSTTWMIRSSGQSGSMLMGGQVGEILMRQIGMRIQVEILSITVGVVVGCLGGNLYFVVSRLMRRKRPQETPPTADQLI